MLETSAKEMAEMRWNDLIENGKFFSGISESSDEDFVAPVWFDPIKFNRAQQLARKYHFSLTLGQFIGLLFLLFNQEIAKPLVATGKSSTVTKLFYRYLSTFRQINLWYEYKPFDKTSKSYCSLRQVRAMHKHVADMMDAKPIVTDPHSITPRKYWVSQYSMAQTQFAFIGFVTLFPKHCGLHSLSNHDLECLLFFWRTIGYCMGIDDRFNVCNGSVNEITELFQLIFWKEWQPLINEDIPPSNEGVCMSKGICLFVGSSSKLSWNVITSYWFPIINVFGNVSLKSFSDYVVYYIMILLIKYLLVWSLIHWIASIIIRLRLRFAWHYKQWYGKRLDAKFKNSIFDDESVVC